MFMDKLYCRLFASHDLMLGLQKIMCTYIQVYVVCAAVVSTYIISFFHIWSRS